MADFDLVIAVVRTLRAVSAIATPLSVLPDGGTGAARIYGGVVPPDAPFPRCYVRRRKPRPRLRSGRAENSTDRRGTIDVLFACTSVETADPEMFVETMDALAETALDYAISRAQIADLVYLRRADEVPMYDQADDRLTFYVGGGTYEFYRQIN